MAVAYLKAPLVGDAPGYLAGCTGKVKLSRAAAGRVRRRLLTVHGIYRCVHCACWHVTSFRAGPLPKRELVAR